MEEGIKIPIFNRGQLVGATIIDDWPTSSIDIREITMNSKKVNILLVLGLNYGIIIPDKTAEKIRKDLEEIDSDIEELYRTIERGKYDENAIV